MTNYLAKDVRGPYTLCDHVGLYCAECLEYIDPSATKLADRLQGHHVFRQAVTKQEFGQDYTIGWVVPVHQKCHQSGISGIDLLSGTLADRFATFKAMSGSDQARIARELHNAGNYGMSLLLKALMIKTAEHGDYDSCWLNAEYCLASGSALSWSRNILSHVERMVPQRGVLRSRPQYLLNKAKISAVHGNLDQALKHVAHAASLTGKLRGRSKKALELVLRRSYTSVRCNIPGASSDELATALADACYAENEAESVYTASTARVLRGNLLFKRADYRGSRDVFEEVLQCKATISWGYRAMAWFHRALCRLQFGEPFAEIYADLVRAQYVQSMFGLTGHAHRASDVLLSDFPHDCMPGHILARWNGFALGRDYHNKHRKYFTELRKQAIGTRGKIGSVWAGVRASLESMANE